MRKLPQGKALLYLAVVRCRIDFEHPSLLEFMQGYMEWFPFLNIDKPVSYVLEHLNTIPNVPASIMKGTYNKPTLQKFLKESGLTDLHELFERQQFKDLMFHTETRAKIEGMMVSGFFAHEIEREVNTVIPDIDPVIVRTYIDCFANYYGMNFFDRRDFITDVFEQPDEKKDLLKCLNTKCKKTIRAVLHLKPPSFDPIEDLNEAANMVGINLRRFFRDDDLEQLPKYLNLRFKAIDLVDKLGVGNKDAAAELLAELKKSPDDPNIPKPPKPMSVDQLNDLRLENVLKPPATPLTI
jgi:hypothetical protein